MVVIQKVLVLFWVRVQIVKCHYLKIKWNIRSTGRNCNRSLNTRVAACMWVFLKAPRVQTNSSHPLKVLQWLLWLRRTVETISGCTGEAVVGADMLWMPAEQDHLSCITNDFRQPIRGLGSYYYWHGGRKTVPVCLRKFSDPEIPLNTCTQGGTHGVLPV